MVRWLKKSFDQIISLNRPDNPRGYIKTRKFLIRNFCLKIGLCRTASWTKMNKKRPKSWRCFHARCPLSSPLWRNLNQMNRLEDKGLLFRNRTAWRTSQTVAMFLRKVRESCVGISPAYRSYSAPGWNIYAKLSIFWLFSHAKVEN